jgi:outer membrane protein OmpA-like peptidoglycan-associated protein
MKTTITIAASLLACGALWAQQPQNQSENEARMAAGQLPIYRSNVTSGTAKAMSYRNRSGATTIDFRGTQLLPKARGEAKVESKQGYMEIEVEFDDLQPANKLGTEYLTYVMWAITPEGRTSNLGEVLLNGTKSKLNVSTDLQVFGLVVTAEPYYSVTRPSDLIVMENVMRSDTLGKVELIDAKYELLQRGQYQRLTNTLLLKPDLKLPLELYEARNAVQIARATGADRFATDTFLKAEKELAQAEAYQKRNAGKKPVTMTSRAAVQTAEDARAIAVKRQEDEALSAERQQAADRTSQAEIGRAAAQSETGRVARDAEAARVAAQANSQRLLQDREAQTAAARAETDRVKREADAKSASAALDLDRMKRDNDARDATAKAEAERLRVVNEGRISAAGAEAARLKLENEATVIAAKADADRLQMANDAKIAAASAEAERLKRDNDAQRLASQAELARIAKEKAQLETDRVELRVLLLKQFNAILQTRDTARGLIVNMSDVLFDSGKSTLRPLAREKLAKVAGIVSGHPGLKLDIEGHTDSVGTDEYNQTLSERRGQAVRDYLTTNGMQSAAVTSKGLGESTPIASNVTNQGRQQNRRVELVISGDSIGTEIGIPVASR